MNLKRTFAFYLFFVIPFGIGCAPATPQATGILQGHVTIGPLVPVQREGIPDPTPAPEVYAARQIVIFSPDGNTEIARADINPQGNYSVELPTGEYLVDINHLGIDFAAGFPATVNIHSDRTTVLDVDIDTGIR
jgi:hypothetical protein